MFAYTVIGWFHPNCNAMPAPQIENDLNTTRLRNTELQLQSVELHLSIVNSYNFISLNFTRLVNNIHNDLFINLRWIAAHLSFEQIT